MRYRFDGFIGCHFVPLNPWFVVSRSRGVLVVSHFMGVGGTIQTRCPFQTLLIKWLNYQAVSAQNNERRTRMGAEIARTTMV